MPSYGHPSSLETALRSGNFAETMFRYSRVNGRLISLRSPWVVVVVTVLVGGLPAVGNGFGMSHIGPVESSSRTIGPSSGDGVLASSGATQPLAPASTTSVLRSDSSASPYAQAISRTPAVGVNPNQAPNQVDLGLTVVNLTIVDINTTASGDSFGPWYDLDVNFATTDPATGKGVWSNTTVGESNNPNNSPHGCQGIWSCGVFPFAFSSSKTATLSITLHDNQQGYFGCYCYVNINGNSATWSLNGFGGAQSSSLSLNGHSCAAPTGCFISISGNSGSRQASVVFALTVETALLSEVAGRLSTYGAYNTFLGALNTGTTSILCPSVNTLLQPDTKAMLLAAVLGVFMIMTLGASTAAELAVAGVMEYVAQLWDVANDITLDRLLHYWGNDTASLYPTAISNIPGLQAAQYTGAVACGNLIYFWGNPPAYGFFGSYYSPNLIYSIESDLSSLMSASQTAQTKLMSGNLTNSIGALQSEQRANLQLQNDSNTMYSDLPAFWGSGVFSSSCQEYQASCGPSAEFLYYNVIGPLSSVLSQDYNLLANDIQALQSMQSNLGIAGCGLPSYAEEGSTYTYNALTPQGGIGPYGISVSGASWLGTSQISYDKFGISGTAPSSYGTYHVSLVVQDNVGDRVAVCPQTITVGFKPSVTASPNPVQTTQSLSLTASIAGGPGGTYTYTWNNIPTGCSSVNQASFTCTPSGTGTFLTYVTATDSNNVAISSSQISVKVNPIPMYTVKFTETGLAAGTQWEVTLAGTQAYSTTSSISFSEPNGTYGFTVALQCGYGNSPRSGSVTVAGSAISTSVTFVSKPTYTLKFTESGAPSGYTWIIGIGGACFGSSTTPSAVTFSEPNGTYSWTASDVDVKHLLGHNYGYVPSPSSGTITISGSGATVSISYSFAQINAPVAHGWSVQRTAAGFASQWSLAPTLLLPCIPFFAVVNRRESTPTRNR